MKAYLRTTIAIYALAAIWHVWELIKHFQRPETDPGFVSGVGAIILITGGLAWWGFRLLRANAGSTTR